MTNGNDLISRADAIERFGEDGTWLERQGVTTLTMVEAKQRAVDIIESLPSADITGTEECIKCQEATERVLLNKASAEAVQGWIPCSDRLPDVDVEVLATVDWLDVRIAWLIKGGAWETDEYILGSDEILAWMPLPTPYKGGDSE